MRAINECGVGLPDNNTMRGATTQALKEIRGNLQFHTNYKIHEKYHDVTGAVSDGESVPEGAYDIKSYAEGEKMSEPREGVDGVIRYNAHTHEEADGWDGSVPFKYIEVKP